MNTISSSRIAFVFSGQGAQYPGMGKDLYDNLACCKEVFDQSDKVLNRPISQLCFIGTEEELGITRNTQPCVLAVDIAAGRALLDAGVKPAAVAGFSLGEYAALTLAGAFELEDVFTLIQLRADAMQKAVPLGEGAMAAVLGISSKEVEELCKRVTVGYVAAANYNGPKQTVVSGTRIGVEQLIELADQEGIRVIPLSVSVPSHCSLMKPAAESVRDEIPRMLKTGCDRLKFPIFANYDGVCHVMLEDVSELLYKQLFQPIRWRDIIQKMVASGIDTFIECGPGRTLVGLIKKIDKSVTTLHVENMETLRETLEILSIS